MGEGPSDPEGIIIGEGPGRDEEEENRPFVGMTGQQLDSELLAVGLRRSRLFIINATACRPPPGKTERIMQRAVTCCRPAFLAQLQNFKPETPMFAMGKWAAFAVMGKKAKAIMKTRGFIRPVLVPKQEDSCTVSTLIKSKKRSKKKAKSADAKKKSDSRTP